MKTKSRNFFIVILLALAFVCGMLAITQLTANAATIEPTSVYVNNHSFTSTNLYYKNGAGDVTNDSENYNAYYDPTTNTLTLNNYNGDCIAIGGAVTSDIKILLIGDNYITTEDQSAISNINGGGIYITSEGAASLTVNSNASQSAVYGIYTGTWGNGVLDIGGKASVTVNVNSTRNDAAAYGAFINGTIDVKDFAKLTVKTASENTNSGVSVGTALYAKDAIVFNTTGKVRIDTSDIPSMNGNIGVYSETNVNLKNAEELEVIVRNGAYAVPVYPASVVDSWTNFKSNVAVENGVLTTSYTPKLLPTVSAAGVVSWENFGDDEYKVVVVNSQSQLVINQSVGYSLSYDLKAKLDELDRDSGDYKITISSKKAGNNVSTSQIVYSYTSSTLQLAAPQNLYWDGAVASWDGVANATSYNVVLTDGKGGAIISKTVSATSYDFTEKIKNGAIFKVVAKADGYLDSPEAVSAPSKSYVVKFLAGSGTGSKDKVILTPAGDDTEVSYTLPNPGGFYAPGGKIFSKWSVEYISGPNKDDPIFFAKMNETLTVNGDVYLTATWKEEAYTVTLYANDGKGTQQSIEDVLGAYVLPECPFDAPDGQEFDRWAIGSALGEQKVPGQGINISDDTLVVALWKDKAFTVAPQNATLTTGAAYVFDYKLSVDTLQINVESYNGVTWQVFSVLTSTPPAANALASGSIGCPAVGWTGTKTLRLAAWDASSNQYYSDEFTVTWIESVFTEQPTSVQVPLGASVLISYGLNIDPDSVKIQVNNGGGWEHLSAADSNEYTVFEGYDSAVTKTYRIEVVKDSDTFHSNSFTVEWSENADEYAFNQAFDNATVKVGEAYNLLWSVNFGTTSQNIYFWNEELGDWEHFDGDGEGYTLFRAANVTNNYDFISNEKLTVKFKIVVSVGDDYKLSSNAFTVSWVSYNLTFKANGGEGADAVVNNLYGEYTLPECSFAAPVGKFFAGWAVGSAEGAVYREGEAYDVTGATEFYAIWEDYTLVDTYAKLVEAINAGKRYVKLTANVSYDAYSTQDFVGALLSFSGIGKTTLDLEGYTLKFVNASDLMGNKAAWIEVLDGHQLTIKNGTLILQNDSNTTDYTAYGMIYVEDATLITESVNMQNKKNGSCVRADSGAVTLNGGELQTLAGWSVYAMYDVALTLDGDVCLRLQNHGGASSSVAGGLYVMTEDVTLDIRKACIKDGMNIPKTMRPTLETHVFYVNGTRIYSDLGLYTTNALANTAGATTYWLDQGTRIYLADAGDDNNYLANDYVVLTSKAVKHSITVENGYASVGGNEVSEGYFTQTVTVTANEIEGKVFVKWTCEGDIGVVFADPNNATTTFEMADCEITIVPVYENAPISHVNVNIYTPIVGEMIFRDVWIEHEGLYASTDVSDNPDWDIQWNCITDSIINMEKGVFLPGKEYQACIQIKTVDTSWSFDEYLMVSVNGINAEVVVYGDYTANIFITFQMPMADFEIPFTDDSRAGLGGWLKIDTAWLEENCSQFADADSIEYVWYKNDEIIAGGTGNSYKIKPEDANSNIYVLIRAQWNGSDYYGLSEVKAVSHKVSVIYINYDPIEGGCYIPNSSHNLFHALDAALGTVKALDWMNSTMAEMQEGDLLEEAGVYNLFLMYQLNDGYVWADDIVFCFNGGELVPTDYADPTNRIIGKLLEVTAAEHTHAYENGIYAYDDEGHWLRCDNANCANRDEDYYQFVEHTSNDATCQTAGSCAICGKGGIEGTHKFENGEYVKTSEEYHEVKCLYCDATDGMENPHFGGTATCTEKAVCEGCGEVYGEFAEHPSYSQGWEYKDQNGHAHVCTADGCTAHDAIVPHTPDRLEATETEPIKCTVCEYIITPATGHINHTPKAEWTTDGEYHWHECIGCEGQQLEKAAHSGGSATCTAKAVCAICNTAYGNTAPHNYTTVNGYKGIDGHANTCSCGAYETPTAHVPDRSEPGENDPVKCTVCDYVITPATGHITHTPKAEWVSDGAYHWHECIGCEGQELMKAAHSGGTATCTEKAVCAICNTAYGDTVAHNYGSEWKTSANEHWNECACGDKANKAAHSGGTATCTEKAVCAICNTAYGNTAAHSHGSEWKTDANEHWNECACGDKANKAAHTDSNNDGKCDTCEYQMTNGGGNTETPDNPDNPNNTPDDPNEDKDGLGAGAIVGIVAGSVAAVGIGGFSLLWFVIKKKSFADLIAVFKR